MKICPEIIIRPSSRIHCGFNPNTIALISSSNVANLKNIVYNAHLPLLLRLLVCRKENNVNNSGNCPYPEHKNTESDKKSCTDSIDELAHLYIRHEQIDKKARSCVLAFIEGKYLNNTDVLLQLFKNTVHWLQIVREKPYYYILHYGQPVFGVNSSHAINNLDKEIKKVFKEYAKDEDVCLGIPVSRRAESLQINHTNKFSFSAA